MWSECKRCGQPVLLRSTKVGEIITAAGIETKEINDRCAILLSHCPACANMAKKGPADAVIVKMHEGAELCRSPDGKPKG